MKIAITLYLIVGLFTAGWLVAQADKKGQEISGHAMAFTVTLWPMVWGIKAGFAE